MSNSDDRATRSERGGRGALQRSEGEPGVGMRIRDYVVQEIIARGGFGTIYRARHSILSRVAAVKVLHAELALSSDAVARFELEARAVNLIRHPNVVDIYEIGALPDGRPFFVMELLEGTDLEQHVGTHGPMQLEAVRSILEPLCNALAAAHEKGIIHRDVKASNVFLSQRDGRQRVVLLDFGVAKLLDSSGAGPWTTSQHLIGTPTSMAPEQLTGKPVDARTDVYGLGALAFHMLTGEPPFAGQPANAIKYMHLHSERPRASTLVPVPPAIDQVIVRALAIRPEGRFQSADDYFSAFSAALAAGPAAARAAQAAAHCARAVGIYVETRPDVAGSDEPDAALLGDIDGVLVTASRYLLDRSFFVALDVGTAALFMRALPLEDPEADRRTRRECILAALELRALVDERSGADSRNHVNVCVHADNVLWVGEKVKGGDLLRLAAWVPHIPIDGVVGTAAALEATGVVNDPVPECSRLVRIRRG